MPHKALRYDPLSDCPRRPISRPVGGGVGVFWTDPPLQNVLDLSAPEHTVEQFLRIDFLISARLTIRRATRDATWDATWDATRDATLALRITPAKQRPQQPTTGPLEWF